jgi:hypothetical protein
MTFIQNSVATQYAPDVIQDCTLTELVTQLNALIAANGGAGLGGTFRCKVEARNARKARAGERGLRLNIVIENANDAQTTLNWVG